MTDFLADKRNEITDRLNELKPLMHEYERLQAAAAALAGIPGSEAPPNGRRGPGRPRRSRKAPAANAGRKSYAPKAAVGKTAAGKRKGGGRRAAETLRHVTEQPGITIPELAAKMAIKQNYLYRVLPGLEQDKKVRKDGRGWRPATADATS